MSEPAATLLSVRGEARVSVEPDSVTLNGLLTAWQDSKPDALRHAATRLNQLTADLGSLGGTPLSLGLADQPLTWSAYASTTEAEHEHDKQTGQFGPTGRIIASVAISIVVRSFDILDQVAGVLANHDALRVYSVTWDVDGDNPSWPEVRAAAIRAAITKGRDYAAALGGFRPLSVGTKLSAGKISLLAAQRRRLSRRISGVGKRRRKMAGGDRSVRQALEAGINHFDVAGGACGPSRLPFGLICHSPGEDGRVPTPRVLAVSRDRTHRFSKVPAASITLLAGLGVLGDAHAGTLVQHRSRVRRDPNQPNLRQVHLLHSEVFDDARAMGYELGPGDLGENILTADLDLLALPTGTLLDLGGPAVRLTGLRNPCAQINAFRAGLLKVVLSRADGTPIDEPAPSTASPQCASAPVIRKAGVMAVVERGGAVVPGQPIAVTLPDTTHTLLTPV